MSGSSARRDLSIESMALLDAAQRDDDDREKNNGDEVLELNAARVRALPTSWRYTTSYYLTCVTDADCATALRAVHRRSTRTCDR